MATALTQFRSIANSPTWQRDATAITSPVRMGVWFLMLNTLIIVGMVITYVLCRSAPDASSSGASRAFAALGLGKMLSIAILLALTLFLTFFVPIRVFGTFLSPRLGRYFDQIVMSGVSPWRYLAGKVVAQNVFLLVMLAVSLPYFLLCLSFGGVSLGYVAICALSLVVYANLLVVAMLAAAMIMSEIWALALVIVFFVGAAALGMAPWGPHPLNVTPSALVITPIYQSHLDLNPSFSMSDWFYRGPFHGLSLFQSHWMLFMLEACMLLLLGWLAVALGPLNCLAKGLNTFGEAVFRGDKKRSAWFRKRFDLRRRAELSFLYENTSRAWRAKDFGRRWMMREILFVLLLGTALIWLYWLVSITLDDSFYGVHLVFACCTLLLNLFLFTDTWISDRLRCGNVEVGTLNTWFFVANSLLIFVAFGWWPFHIAFDPDSGWQYIDEGALFGQLEIFEQNIRLIGFLVLMSWSIYAMLRYQALRYASKINAGLITLVFMGLIWGLPVWIYYLANTSDPFGDSPERVWVLMCSPYVAANVLSGASVGRDGNLAGERPGLYLCMGLHLAIALLMFVLYLRRSKRQLEPRDL